MNSESLVGQQIEQYQIERHIARGGMSDVYLALDVTLQRRVVIKVLLTPLAGDQQFVARFQREALTIARVDHPNIVQIYSTGATPPGQPYIAMQYIEGGSLQDQLQRLKQQKQFIETDQALRITRQIAAALIVAHDAGIVHRDLKPSNILLRQDGTPVLVDLGIAAIQRFEDTSRLTQTGALIGTPHYMSPEQGRGMPIDGRSDLYSLGLVLYEMLTGERPFEANESIAVLHKQVYENPVPITDHRPQLPASIGEIVHKLLQKDPDSRYQTARELVAVIDSVLSGEKLEPLILSDSVLSAPPTSPPFPPSRTSGRGCSIVGLLALIWSALLSAWKGIVNFPQKLSDPFPKKGSGEQKFSSIDKQTGSFKASSQSLVMPKTEIRLGSDLPFHSKNDSPPTFGTMILDPQLGPILNPFADNVIREFLTPQEPKRIAHTILFHGRNRFLLTGYGSFGGTKLAGEVAASIQDALSVQPQAVGQRVLVFHMQITTTSDLSSLDCQVVVWFGGSGTKSALGKFTWKVAKRTDKQPVEDLFDAAERFANREKGNTKTYKDLKRITQGELDFVRIVFIIDKVPHQELLQYFIDQPIFEHERFSYLFVVEREQYNRWPVQFTKRLKTRRKFQVWYVPCLWESEHQLIEKMMQSMFKPSSLSTPPAQELLQAFKKYIAFISRGQVGAIFYELRQGQYWHVNIANGQPYILIDDLDADLLQHHSMMQDILESNWPQILGSSFVGQKAVDRARQGIYSLVDWIIDAATFTLEDVLTEAGQRPVLVTSYPRLRDDVVMRLLGVLVDNHYLKRVDNAYDIVWGRDASEQRLKMAQHPIHVEKTVIIQKQLSDLYADYEAASSQLGQALSAVDRNRIERQVKDIQRQIERLESEAEDL